MYKTIAIILTLLAMSFSNATFAKGPKPSDSITDIVVAVNDSTGEFSILRSLLETTGLAEVLDVGGQFTVFAPTDAAFEPLLGILAQLNEEQVVTVLLYHVTDGRRSSKSLVKSKGSKPVEMLNEDYVLINADGTITDTNEINDALGDAAIVDANIKASNGIIHVIDQVLVPEDL